MKNLIKKTMAQIGQESKITVGLLLALFPIIIGSWTWVSVQIATLRTELNSHIKEPSIHYQRFEEVEDRMDKILEEVNENKIRILEK